MSGVRVWVMRARERNCSKLQTWMYGKLWAIDTHTNEWEKAFSVLKRAWKWDLNSSHNYKLF